jgi:hypothetical protein
MKKSKRNVLIAIFAAILLIVGIVSVCLFLPDKSVSNSSELNFHLPDYDEDIFQNKAYVSFIRDLRYGAMGVEQLYSYENDFDDASAECQFFLRYFHTVINGNYQEYPSYFATDFFENAPKFTMQMIYEPYVFFHSTSEEEIDGENVTLYNFHVEYKIFKNNGTFRNDVSSNTAIPQIYQLTKDLQGNYTIYRILDVKTEP